MSMLPSLWPLASVGAVIAVVSGAWHKIQATAWPVVLVWLPVAGPVAVITLAPWWQAAQPDVTPHTGVITVPALYGSAWQLTFEHVVITGADVWLKKSGFP